MGNTIYTTIINISSDMKETIYKKLGIENKTTQTEKNTEFPEYDIVDRIEYYPYTFSKQNK
jgi:hypothetical protein